MSNEQTGLSVLESFAILVLVVVVGCVAFIIIAPKHTGETSSGPIPEDSIRVTIDKIVQDDVPDISFLHIGEVLAMPHNSIEYKTTYGDETDERLLEAAQNGECKIVKVEEGEWPEPEDRALHTAVNRTVNRKLGIGQGDGQDPFIFLQATVTCPENVVQ